jgi:hypothetical protein
MLSELEAISFEHQFTLGSRTHPWVILARNGTSKPTPYVIKLFTKQEVEQRYAVAKEIFSSVIANEFELPAPAPALVNLNTSEFIASLSPDLANILHSRDYRIKFGCKYINGTLPYNEDVPLDYFDQFDDIDSIFAFDNLIYNTDRNKGKPDNFRLRGDEYYLIDHEYSLAITRQILTDFEDDKWVYPFANHIFYFYLLLRRDSTDCFKDFEEKLNLFDPDILDSYEAQLRSHYYDPPYEDYELLKEYLKEIKLKSKKFSSLLQKRFLLV